MSAAKFRLVSTRRRYDNDRYDHGRHYGGYRRGGHYGGYRHNGYGDHDHYGYRR
jgi:hypothetical protein